jgi:hypothetical protein
MNERLAAAIKDQAARIGANPADLATVMSYETGGTFDPWKKGPTTKWGTHRGLIQMGGPQRKQYGYSEGAPIEDLVAASARYLVDRGYQPGMGLLDMYSIINAGGPGLYDRSDEAAGGAPGTVRDKVNGQMEGHKQNAVRLLNGEFTPSEQTNPFDPVDGDIRPQITTDPGASVGSFRPANVVEQREAAARAPQPYESFSQEFGAAFSSQTITAQALRWASEGTYDPNFTIGEERGVEIAKQYPENYRDFLLSSGSEVVLQQRLKWASEDVERQQRLAAGGWSATGASLLAGAVDPIVSIPSLLTGGIGSAALAGFSTVGRVATSSAVGAVTNAAIDYGSQRAFSDPHADPLAAAGIGAVFGAFGGMLMRAPNARFEADLALEAAARANQLPTASGAPLPGNAGAARNPLQRDSLIPADRELAIEIRDEDVARGFGGWLRKGDVTGQMTTAKNPLARLIGASFFEETAGFADHSVVPDSVNSRFVALHRKMTGNFDLTYLPAKNAYIAEGNLSTLNMTGRAKREAEFNRLVSDYIWDPHPSPETNQHVVKAGGILRKQMAEFADELNRAGLWNGAADPHYLPLVAKHERIAHLDQLIHNEVMERFIKDAIRQHASEISEELAQKMARGYWSNIRKAGFGIEDGMSKSLHINDREGFKNAFYEALDNKNLLSDDEIGQVFDLLSGMMDAAKKPASDSSKGVGYLKRRTLLDYDYRASLQTREGGTIDLRMRDLFEDDAELLFRRYARSMSGRIEFAKTKIVNPSNGEMIADGLRSEADLSKLKQSLAESYRLMPGPRSAKEKELANMLENIDFGWKRINGIPVYGQEKAFAQWARRIKTSQFIRLMSNMGLNQVQETWKIVSLTGFRAAVSQMPAIRTLARTAKTSGASRDRLLNELTDMTGIGLENLWSRYDLRLADDRLGAETGGRITQFVDNVLDAGQRLTTNVSLMRHITAYQQRWAMKAITQQIAGMARKARRADGSFDFSKIKPRDRDRLASIGLGEKDAKLLFRNILDHSEFEGRKIVGINTAAWDTDAVSKFRVFLGRYTDRLVQMNDYGALSKWMSNPVASLFVQFRSFVFGAFAKSTLWSLNHGAFTDPRMLVLLLGELAFGVATFAVRQSGTALLDDEKWEETMDPVNLLKNGWARTATASVVPMFLDSLLQFTPLGPQFGQARASGSPTDAFLGSPVTDQLKSAAQFTRGAASAFWEDEDMTQTQIKAGVRAFAPLGNWAPLTAALGMLISDRPEK